MKTNVLDLLDYLSRTGVEMGAMCVYKQDTAPEFGATLQRDLGVIGSKGNEGVKRGLYLYSDVFDNDADLLMMADEIYNHENENCKILYFAI